MDKIKLTHPRLLVVGCLFLVIIMASLIGVRLARSGMWSMEFLSLLLFIGIVVAASFGGFKAGLLVTALSFPAAAYFFSKPYFGIRIQDPNDWSFLLMFIVAGMTLSWLVDSIVKTQRALENKHKQLQKEVTERQLLLKRTEEWKQRYEAAMISSGSILYDSNRTKRYILLAGECEKILGFTAEELQGNPRNWLALVHPEDSARFMREVTNTTLEQEPFHLEYRVRRKDGTYATVCDDGQLVIGANGELHVIGFVKDVTLQKETERLLASMDRRKDEFIATLAHELRNPLAPLVNALSLLRSSPGNSDIGQRCLDVMERQLQQMVHLVNDLMDVSRITTGQIVLRKKLLNINSVLEAAIQTSRPHIEERGHTLIIAVDPSPVVLEGDATRLCQVFSNILNNAAKFTPRGGQIELSSKWSDGSILISIRDNGAGIPADALSSIFEMFNQAGASASSGQRGLGIGLNLARTIVQLHGGSIEAKSGGIGRGAEFIVRVPATLERLLEEPKSKSAMPNPSHVESKYRVLIVDDNVDGASSMSMMLEVQGYETRICHDGLEAVTAAEQFHPHLILLDIGLPGLSGHEVAREIRKAPWGKNVVLAAVTGWGQDEDKRKSQEAGFNYHFVKPVDPTEIHKLILNISL